MDIKILDLETISAEAIEHEAIGTHLLVTFRGCQADFLNDSEKLRALTEEAARSTGATVLETCSHKFSPQGVTTVVVLAESHASLHTYPESRVVFWDCFTCGTTCNPQLSVVLLKEALMPTETTVQTVARS